MSFFITASPNETERIIKAQQKEARIERLKQIREAEKKLATERRQKFQKQTKKEWGAALDKLFVEFEEVKENQIKELDELTNIVYTQKLGNAQADAKKSEEEKFEVVTKLREDTASRQLQELVLSGIAARTVIDD
jgi:5'-deoxynucleotidase YfbR-like HD superfamily hydrolase